MKFGLSNEDFQLVLDLAISPLKKHGARVWVFGSRAQGHHRQFSDLDILYSLSNELPPGYLAKIITDLEDSRLPIKIDLVRDTDLATSYVDNILRSRIEV